MNVVEYILYFKFMDKNTPDISPILIGSAKWLAEMKKGNSKLVAELYRRYKQEFVIWIQHKTSCNQELAIDVFQDSVIALYENIKKGKITSFEQSVKHYLFGIGKKVYYMHLRKNKQEYLQTVSLEDNEKYLYQLDVKTPPGDKEEKTAMLSLLLKMKDPCKSILYLYYYKEYKIKEVAEQLKYKSENVVRVQKARCMTALRKAYAKQNK